MGRLTESYLPLLYIADDLAARQRAIGRLVQHRSSALLLHGTDQQAPVARRSHRYGYIMLARARPNLYFISICIGAMVCYDVHLPPRPTQSPSQAMPCTQCRHNVHGVQRFCTLATTQTPVCGFPESYRFFGWKVSRILLNFIVRSHPI